MKHFKQKAISLILGICLIAGCVTVASAAERSACRNSTAVYHIVQILSGKSKNNLMNSLSDQARMRQIIEQFFAAPKTQDAPEAEDVEICTNCEAPTEEVPAPVEKPQDQTIAPQAQSVATEYEKKVVELVNIQRRANGLAPVELSEELCVKARVKSQDMATNRYFDHNSPTYGSPFSMMSALGVTYRYAGENIAMGYSTPEAVVNAWMNSEGHRANILNANYSTLGVGYVADGNYWTQWFIG